MNFEQWLAANGYDAEKLTTSQRKHLMAAWKDETTTIPVAAPVAAAPVAPAAPTPAIAAAPTTYEEELAAARRESERRSGIERLVADQIRQNLSNPDRVERLNLLRNAAVQGGWDIQKTQLELLKESRNLGPIISIASDSETNAEVLEAAALRGVGYPLLEKKFSGERGARILSAVDKQFRRGIGLRELIDRAAEHNAGYRGSRRDLHSICRAAFAPQSNGFDFRSDVGPSAIDVTGILSNVANKMLELGFLYTEQAWRSVARIVQANDYKQISLYRLTSGSKFEKIPPGGEIKHGTLGELSYTLQVDAYGKVYGISEQDIRNDDLGAFATVGQEIGRGAGDGLNDIFWAEWLDDSNFFNTDNSKLNYISGATTNMSVAGLDAGEVALRKQQKPDGTPLGAMGRVLLTPAAVANTAAQLMGSQGLVVGTTPASGPVLNVFYGRYAAVSSVYLDAASATAWYLLADPANIACIAIAFLDGVDTPTVETGAFNFDMLGMAMRGTYRWGCKKQEYRGGIKSKGSA